MQNWQPMSQDELNALLVKLQQQVKEGEDSDFSRKEVEAIRRVIKTYEMLEGWGFLGRRIIWLAMSAAALAVAWSQIKESYFQ